MLSTDILSTVLAKHFNIDEKTLAVHQKTAQDRRMLLEEYLLSNHIVDENKLYASAAEVMNVPFVDLSEKDIQSEILNLVPAQFAEVHEVIAFEKNADSLALAMTDPLDIQTIEFLRRKTGLKPQVYLTSSRSLKTTLRRFYSDLAGEKFITELVREPRDSEAGDLKKAAEELPIINIVNSVIEHAVAEEASDIHIEPSEKEVTVRYRIDGILQTIMNLPKKVANGITARVKILANLKIDEHMIPQDGRFKIKLHDEPLSFRVSIVPVYDGEKIVMRVLQEGQKPLTLEELGFLPEPKEIVERAIDKPHGMVLVTGPTGSGKTTTLYSILGMINTPEVNICTIEDPIEYHVSGINQSQINPKAGFTFANGLRSFLRQDPDIIMVGEIRDQETAEIALHAAMTGHLVLSTLHTNDAPTTIPRLADMNIPPFLIAFTTNVIVAQRLVRKICAYCKKPYHMNKNEIQELSRLIDAKKLVELFSRQKLKLTVPEKNVESLTFYHGEGCGRCKKSGYKGRIGIYEVLESSKELTKLINSSASANDIKDFAIKNGMTTILEDGLIKAKQGITTIEEVLDATKE